MYDVLIFEGTNSQFVGLLASSLLQGRRDSLARRVKLAEATYLQYAKALAAGKTIVEAEAIAEEAVKNTYIISYNLI